MIILKTAVELSEYLSQQQKTGKTLGFVPTMGALHDGHISLILNSNQESSVTVCSIFVNPTQFNSKEDLLHYPVTIEKDIEQLIKAGCDVLFLPGEAEVYPPGSQAKIYDLGDLDSTLEGYYRPGHFQGVCQGVDRLLEIVTPDFLFLGQKDYQQCKVLTKLVELTGRKVRVKIAPTIREKDGLAMSSRNLRLITEQRIQAVQLYKVLNSIKESFHKVPFSELRNSACQQLIEKGFTVDYVEIVNQESLRPAQSNKEPVVALVAATLGDIRLIDNMLLN